MRNKLDDTDYYAVSACSDLPRECHREDHVIQRGAAVGFGRWFFFPATEPALAFGRAARMSLDCTSGYGVYAAAHEIKFCERHGADECVLLVDITGGDLARREDEVEALKRFVQAVKEYPWSSMWRAPTGYLTELSGGRVVTTGSGSLPL
ncbi:hypothetical protein [Prauserella muralis]|uniref:hypothetical protein n=1 Tax=Prauserella muralis TaxID=588067 RepID=UPI001BAD7320|nr:hypothetical protein [Prauserella muralis]